MDDRTETRQELANVWSERVNAVEEHYRHARVEADAAPEACGCDPTSAQIEALIQMFGRETAAMDEYRLPESAFGV